jgi:hypothetical protein
MEVVDVLERDPSVRVIVAVEPDRPVRRSL